MNETEEIKHHPDSDSFDIRKSWEGIKRACFGHKLLILFVTLLTIGVVVAYIFIWPPIYHGTVTVIVDPPEDTQRDTFYQAWSVFRKDLSLDEAQRMRSGPIVEKVVDELGLTYDDVYHTFLAHTAYLWTESKVGKMYRKAKERIFPPQKTPYDPTPEQIDRARTIHGFQTGIAVAAVGESNVGLLVIRGPSARVSDTANTLIRIYLESRKERHVEEAQQAYDSLYPEVEKAKVEVFALEADMEDYYNENGLLLMFERDKVELSLMLELTSSIVETESVLATMRETLRTVDAQIAIEEREIITVRVYQKNGIRESLKETLSTLHLALDQTLLRFRMDSPEVYEIEEQILSVKKFIAAESDFDEYQSTRVLSETYEGLRQRRKQLEADIEGVSGGVKVRRQELARLKARVAGIPQKMKIANQLGREHSMAERKYVLLSEKLTSAEISRVSAESAPPSMRVIEYAYPPDKAGWPNKKLLLASALAVGFVAGVALALLVELLYARVDHSLQIEGGPFYAILRQDKAYVNKLFMVSGRKVGLGRG